MRTLLVYCVVFLFFNSFYSCKKARVSPLDAGSYFSAYTQGMINEDEPIEFRFINATKIDSLELMKCISTKPSFKFSSSFDRKKGSLIIDPTDNLHRGKNYEVIIDLERIFPNTAQEIFATQLKVYDQYLKISKQGIFLDETGNSYLEMQLTTALKEELESLYKIFDIDKSKVNISETANNNYLVKILFDPNGKDQKIKWDGKELQSAEKGAIMIETMLLDFGVTNSFYNRKSKECTIYFSQLLDQKQDAKGLVTIAGKDADYSIENNRISVQIKNSNYENLELVIEKGIKSKGGNSLKKSFHYTIEPQIVKPQIQWLDEGVYIPSSGLFKIPFKARGLKSVIVSVIAIKNDNASRYIAWNQMAYMDELEMVRHGNLVHQSVFPLNTKNHDLQEWNEFGLDMTNAFEREKGTIYHLRLDFLPQNTILECVDASLKDFEKDFVSKEWFNTRYRHYNYYQQYNYQESKNPCKVSYYLDYTTAPKNIHCTNVFPIIKKAGNNVFVAVKELSTNIIANGARVDLINLQGQTTKSAEISSGGTTIFKDELQNTKAVRVSYKGEISYFPIHEGEELSITEFDVSSNAKDVDSKIFVYTDRDVWRPSDTIFMNVMLNRSKFDFPSGLPIVVNLRSPKNVLYNQYLSPLDDDSSIYTFKMPTHLEAETGYWKAEIKIGPLTKYKTLRVETIRPNVVDLEFKFKNNSNKWIFDRHLSGELSVNYLTGFAMQAGKVHSSANVSRINKPFKKYDKYAFAPSTSFSPLKDHKLWSLSSDENGNAAIQNTIDFKGFEGVVSLTIDSKIDLPGGGLNTETNTYIVSPFSSYVGIEKSRGTGWRGSYNHNEIPEMDIIHLDQEGEIISAENSLEIEVYKYENDWWYERYRLSRDHRSNNANRYELVYSEKINTKNGKASYKHNKDHFESGMYLLRVRDPKSKHSSEHSFHHIKTENYSVGKNPIFFNIELEKRNYTINEKLKVKLPALKDAQALVSIESGDQILDAFWMDLNNPSLELNVKENWFPNFYLNISLVQNYGQENNDLPLRMYSVEKISVEEPASSLTVLVDHAEKVQPNSTFEFTVSEQSGLPIEYTVAIADVGLLNLTGYESPNPLVHFAKQLALRVHTWDIFNQLIYFLNPSFAGILSIGGDGLIEKELDKSADFNRFEPVCFHLGPFKLEGNGKNTHSVSIPNYIGKLRISLVACGDISFGHNSSNVQVSSPLMIQSQLPRALNLTDEVHIPITLFKDEDDIKEVSVKAKADSDLVSFSTNQLSTDLTNSKQKTETIILQTAKEAGTVELAFDASSGNYEAHESTKLFINYPNGFETKTTYYEINPNSQQELELECFGYKKTKSLSLSLSGALLPDFSKAYSDLIAYPHGCLEQSTSKAFALIFIDELIAVSTKEKQLKEEYLNAAVLKIQSFQKADGRFSYWENGYYHSWSDLYAGHFLIEAKAKNKIQNPAILKKWLEHKKAIANSWRMAGLSSNYQLEKESVLQAYRLYLLARAGQASKSAMNRFSKENLSSKMAKVFLSGAYYYSGMEEHALKLLNEALVQGSEASINNYSFGSNVRNKAILISLMSKLSPGESLDRYYREWVKEVNQKSWLSTQEKGFAFLACSEYLKNKPGQAQELDFEISSSLYSQIIKIPSTETKTFLWNWDQLKDAATIKNNSSSVLYLIKTERAISDQLYENPSARNLSMKTSYKNNRGQPIDFDNIKHGEDIRIQIDIKNTDILDHDDLALSIRVPSSWELLNPRLYSTNADEEANFIFQDFRDDKVYTYFKLNKNQSRSYTFKAKASLKGAFYMPPVRCESMYNGEVYAVSSGIRIKVK